MNVLRYILEISKKKEDPQNDVYSIMYDDISNDQNLTLDTYKEEIKKEWEKLSHKSLKSINSSENILAGFEKNGSRVFLFEKRTNGVKNKNNLTIEVIAFGDLPFEKILNDSFKKIDSVLTSLQTKYIDDSEIIIYPYDTNNYDIYSPDLKIKALIVPQLKFSKKQWFSCSAILMISLIFLVLYYKNGAKENFNLQTKEVAVETKEMIKESPKIETELAKNDIYLSFAGSGFFYIFLEIIIYILYPLVFERKIKTIVINDLSSMIESSSKINSFYSKETEKKLLIDPEIEDK